MCLTWDLLPYKLLTLTCSVYGILYTVYMYTLLFIFLSARAAALNQNFNGHNKFMLTAWRRRHRWLVPDISLNGDRATCKSDWDVAMAKWQIGHINYRNLFYRFVCIAIVSLPANAPEPPTNSFVVLNLGFLSCHLISSLALSVVLALYVKRSESEPLLARWKRATKCAFGIVFCLGQVRNPLNPKAEF